MQARAAVFIDGSNLYHGAKRAGVRADVPKLARRLLGDRELVRIYYYCAPLPQEMYGPEAAAAQQRYLERLEMGDYVEVKRGRLEPRPKGWEEKGVDTRIATDMVYMAAQDLYDVAILISGDADLAYTVQHVKNLGKHVEVAYFKKGMAHELRKAGDRFIELTPKAYANCLKAEKKAEPPKPAAKPKLAAAS